MSKQLAYSLPQLSDATGLSVSALRKEINENRLVASYYGTKPLVAFDEGQRFIASLPTEKPSKA